MSSSKQEQKKEHLIMECELSQQSISWWKSEMERLWAEAESLEKEDPLFLDTKRRSKIEDKMNCLITRGEIEMDISDGLEEKIKSFHTGHTDEQ